VGLPAYIEEAELASYGTFGLIDAIDKFDRSRCVKFETYAAQRIKGAILDELRAVDWVPRSVRAKAAAVQRASAKLRGELCRNPDETEVAAELGVSADALNRARLQISLTYIGALDEVRGSGDDDGSLTMGDRVIDDSHDPGEVFDACESRRLLAAALNRLPDRERLVITLYYYEAMTQADIGDALGVTESRVCQILSTARSSLREAMHECGLGDDSGLLDRLERSA
jgi:RNA polymerase sigma factor for flagellar operon FliA